MSETLRRRWFKFWMGTLFLVMLVTLIGGWQIHERRARKAERIAAYKQQRIDAAKNVNMPRKVRRAIRRYWARSTQSPSSDRATEVTSD
jgi:cytochrome oxidase assembly protein ShyY1